MLTRAFTYRITLLCMHNDRPKQWSIIAWKAFATVLVFNAFSRFCTCFTDFTCSYQVFRIIFMFIFCSYHIYLFISHNWQVVVMTKWHFCLDVMPLFFQGCYCLLTSQSLFLSNKYEYHTPLHFLVGGKIEEIKSCMLKRSFGFHLQVFLN